MSSVTKPTHAMQNDLYVMYTGQPTFAANVSPNTAAVAASAAKAANGGLERRRGSTPSAADDRLADASVARQLAYCSRGNVFYAGPQAAVRQLATNGSQYSSGSVYSGDLLNNSCTSISSTTPLHRPHRSGIL
jgi:hypothetical protein